MIVRPMWYCTHEVLGKLAQHLKVEQKFHSPFHHSPVHHHTSHPLFASSSANSVSFLKPYSVEQWDTSIFSLSSVGWTETFLHRTIHSHLIINTSFFSMITPPFNQNRLWCQREHGESLYPRSTGQNSGIKALKLNIHYVISFLQNPSSSQAHRQDWGNKGG